MARRVILSDDLTGLESEDVETVTYGISGTFYEIDLSEVSWKKMEKALTPFIKASREITRADAIRRMAAPSDSVSDTENIRAWARENGFEVGDRGRLSEEIRAAYAKYVESEMDKKNDGQTGADTRSNEQVNENENADAG